MQFSVDQFSTSAGYTGECLQMVSYFYLFMRGPVNGPSLRE